MFRVFWVSADDATSIEVGNSNHYNQAQEIAANTKELLIAEGDDGSPEFINAGRVVVRNNADPDDRR